MAWGVLILVRSLGRSVNIWTMPWQMTLLAFFEGHDRVFGFLDDL